MDYQKTASEILKHIGGEKNVVSLEHCSTRLRFILADRSKADADAVKKIPGVMGVADKVQFQIIIGNSVVEVYEAILKQASFSGDAKAEKKSEKSNIGRTVMEFVIAVFQPIIPAIAGGGILKAMLSLCVLIGILDNTSTLFTILNLLGDAPLYFLPLMVAVSASKRLKVNSFVALSVVGALLLPNMTTLLSAEGGTVFLGFTLQKIAYAYQIFPALLSMFLLAAVERFFNKIVPKPVRILFVPMLCLLIVVPSTLLVLGPLGYNFGTLLTSAILFLYDKLGFIAVGLLAMVLPFCTAAGMHKAFVPYAISSLASMGSELVYLPANLAHNISESGACFGVVLRTKNKELRTTALSAGISALFGITEPALYGVTLQNKRVTLGVMAGALLSGLSIGFTVVRAYTIVGPGLASMATFIDPEGINTMNIVWAFVG
ncbi:PTS transporter subunit EIIC, partial [Hungatella effluvii]